MESIEISKIRVEYLPGNPLSLAVMITSDGIIPSAFDAFDTNKASLFCVSCPDWNRYLSPWPASACFKGGEAFAGEADEYLSLLTKAVLPEAEKHFCLKPEKRSVLGYSLAGLFALYAFFETDIFRCAASVSGSMWYDGLLDYLRGKMPPSNAETVYLSVGDKEANTKNKRLQTVESATVRACEILKEKNLTVRFELNKGNHFFEPDLRLLRALNAVT